MLMTAIETEGGLRFLGLSKKSKKIN